jgi:hypothetical protein
MATTQEHIESSMTVLKPRTKPLTVFVPVGTLDALRSLAADHERSVSAEVRWLLRQYVESPDPDSFGDVR